MNEIKVHLADHLTVVGRDAETGELLVAVPQALEQAYLDRVIKSNKVAIE